MPFTAQETANVANVALDFYLKGDVFQQAIQQKPLMAALIEKQKTFPGGKEKISVAVQGDYDTTAFAGYTHNDTVSYTNPANIKRAEIAWKEIHNGITVTHTELKMDGISVTDSAMGSKTSEHSDREQTALADIFENKMTDMGEAWAIKFNETCWKDGTQDAKLFSGVRYFVANTPTTGVVAGIDRSLAANDWWRNRATLNITASASAQTLTRTLRSEVRQLRRYGGLQKALILCGSEFLNDLELEVQEKGYYSQTGFSNNGQTDIGMAAINMRGVGNFQYDPTLDDEGLQQYCYILDIGAGGLELRVMEGEDRKSHSPARPYDQYTLYRGVTWTGGLIAKRLNSSGVYTTTV